MPDLIKNDSEYEKYGIDYFRNPWSHLNISRAHVENGFLRLGRDPVIERTLSERNLSPTALREILMQTFRIGLHRIETKESFSGPIDIHLVARTYKHCIRLDAFNGAGILINWELDPTKLRVHRPDGNEQYESGSLVMVDVKPLKPKQWYKLRWRITKSSMLFSVDGNIVFTEKRSYDLSSKKPVQVRSADSGVNIKSLTVKSIK